MPQKGGRGCWIGRDAGDRQRLDAAACAYVQDALEQGPQAYGLPVTLWTLRDLQALLLRERGITVSVCTLHRVRACLGLSLSSSAP